MKKLVGMVMGAAMLYKTAKKYGIHNFQDVKELLGFELKSVATEVKHELVA